MNWFERYGIVGMFCIAMTTMWMLCLFPGSGTLLEKAYVPWVCGLASLPLGYLIMVCSQRFYYCRGNNAGIHRKYWEHLDKAEANSPLKKIADEIKSAEQQNNEAAIEVILTYYDRMHIDDVDANKSLSAFATKRFDVISVNNGFRLAIFLSLIFACLLRLIVLDWDLEKLIYLFWLLPISAWIALGIATILWFVLGSSTAVLSEQIMEIGKRKFDNIKIQDSEQVDPNASGSRESEGEVQPTRRAPS